MAEVMDKNRIEPSAPDFLSTPASGAKPAVAPMLLTQLQEQMRLPSALRILVLAPHPDDFDAIAVTLRYFHRRGDTIHLAVLTNGASGVQDGFGAAHTDEEKTRLREAEQIASCRRFGLTAQDVQFLRLPLDGNGNPFLDDANRQSIRNCLQRHRPDLVFMPHGNDSNVTHQRTYALFRAVVLQDRLRVLAVLNQDAKTLTMRRDLCTPFDEADAQWKAELLRLHASQHQRNLNTRGHGFDERVLAINRQAGAALQVAYAEVFELERFE
jgi:LmbE family N-acetylglucosaminyl deacetylase